MVKLDSSNEGPKVFLNRLKRHGYVGLEILNPTKGHFWKSMRMRKLYVARLDGVYLYDFDLDSLNVFLRSRNCNVTTSFFTRLFFCISKSGFRFVVNLFLSRYCYLLTRNTQYIVFQSKISLDMHLFLFGNDFLRGKKFKIINNGVAFSELNFKEYKRDETFKLVISASLYRPHKRLLAAIKLINELCKLGDYHLFIYGLVPEYMLKDLIKLDLSNCSFMGRVNSELLNEIMSDYHLQLSLALFDPCPNVVLDGLSSGLIVLTPGQSGAAELLNNKRECIVDERKDIGYFNSLDICNLDFPIDEYIKKVMNIQKNYETLRKEIFMNAKSRLDIKIISKDYKEFAQ